MVRKLTQINRSRRLKNGQSIVFSQEGRIIANEPSRGTFRIGPAEMKRNAMIEHMGDVDLMVIPPQSKSITSFWTLFQPECLDKFKVGPI
jgi:hypothetical protein